MILKGSRYKKASNYSIIPTHRRDKSPIKTMDFRLFVTEPHPSSSKSRIDTQRFDVWAHNAYRDPKKWWIIADSLEEIFVLDAYIGDTAVVPPANTAEYGEY